MTVHIKFLNLCTVYASVSCKINCFILFIIFFLVRRTSNIFFRQGRFLGIEAFRRRFHYDIQKKGPGGETFWCFFVKNNHKTVF